MNGNVIAVWSSKGGVGKTTIALALGVHLRKSYGANVVIVDLDIESGDLRARMSAKGSNIPHAAGLIATHNFSAAEIEKWLWSDEYGVQALFAPTRVSDAVAISDIAVSSYRSIVGELRNMADVVVLDCGESAADQLFSRVALPEADGLCIVIDNERAALVSLRTTLDEFRDVVGLVAPEKTCLVLNQKVEKAGVSEADVRSLFSSFPVVASLVDNRGQYTGLSSKGTYIIDHPGDVGVAMRNAMDAVINTLCPNIRDLKASGTTATSPKTPKKNKAGFFQRLVADDPILRRLIKTSASD